jgi:hypothetical protein
VAERAIEFQYRVLQKNNELLRNKECKGSTLTGTEAENRKTTTMVCHWLLGAYSKESLRRLQQAMTIDHELEEANTVMMKSAWRAAENEQIAVVKPLRTRLATALAASHDAENEEDACAEFKDIKLKVSLIRYRESYVDWLDKANASEKEYLALLLACKRKNDKVNPQLETLLRRALGPGSLDPSLNLKLRRQCLRPYYATNYNGHVLEYLKTALGWMFIFLC